MGDSSVLTGVGAAVDYRVLLTILEQKNVCNTMGRSRAFLAWHVTMALDFLCLLDIGITIGSP